MKPNKGSNGIELINYLIKRNKKEGEEIHEIELKKMDPSKYLKSALNFYKDYEII